MWNVAIAGIPGPWPPLPLVVPSLVSAAAAFVGLAFLVIRAAGRDRRRVRPVDGRVRRLHGMRAA